MKHPTYLQMCAEAIASLGKRGGSSAHAIAKFVGGKYGAALPPDFIFRRLLSHRLRRLVALRQLVKVKASYKLPPARLYRRSISPSNKRRNVRSSCSSNKKNKRRNVRQPTANNGIKEEQYHEQKSLADADAMNKKTDSTSTITTPSSSPRKRPGPWFKKLRMSSMIFYAMKRKRPASSASCVVPRRKLRRYGDSVLRPIPTNS